MYIVWVFFLMWHKTNYSNFVTEKSSTDSMLPGFRRLLGETGVAGVSTTIVDKDDSSSISTGVLISAERRRLLLMTSLTVTKTPTPEISTATVSMIVVPFSCHPVVMTENRKKCVHNFSRDFCVSTTYYLKYIYFRYHHICSLNIGLYYISLFS